MKSSIIKIVKKSKIILNLTSVIYSICSFFIIKGRIKNKIHIRGAFLKNTRIQIKGKNNVIQIAPENRLNNCLLHISGNNCEINIAEHCILSHLELWIEDDGCKISIGYRTTSEGGHIAATEGKYISIGEDCMFSHGIEIRNGDSHSIFDNISKQRTNPAQPIIIGDHVWLGADVKILKGVTIESRAIIATGAIVTNFVKGNSIYAGIPAKKVKENIYWERER